MKKIQHSQTILGVFGGILGAVGMFAIFLTISSVIAAPTQAPPTGNPTFPLIGADGPEGTQGPAGATGATGPAGTSADVTGSLKTVNYAQYHNYSIGYTGGPSLNAIANATVPGPGILTDVHLISVTCPGGLGPSNVQAFITNPSSRTVRVTATCTGGLCWGWPSCDYSGNFSVQFYATVIY